MKTEIQLQFPIPDQMLQVDFLDKWVDANHVLDMELHEAAMEKTDRHGTTDVGTLWAVVQKFQKSEQPLPGGGAVATKQAVYLEDLENSQYELLLKQLEFDRKTFRAFDSATLDAQNHMHHVKMNHEKEVHARRVSIVQKFMADRMRLEVYSDQGALVTEFEQYRNSVKGECQVQIDNVVRWQKSIMIN